MPYTQQNSTYFHTHANIFPSRCFYKWNMEIALQLARVNVWSIHLYISLTYNIYLHVQ